ncbi:hypothetical protein ADK90_28010 [Streptomyces sp. XY413]|nr:hypothetical protein ADK90_28010 [Streptomyces sp. XY413]
MAAGVLRNEPARASSACTALTAAETCSVHSKNGVVMISGSPSVRAGRGRRERVLAPQTKRGRTSPPTVPRFTRESESPAWGALRRVRQPPEGRHRGGSVASGAGQSAEAAARLFAPALRRRTPRADRAGGRGARTRVPDRAVRGRKVVPPVVRAARRRCAPAGPAGAHGRGHLRPHGPSAWRRDHLDPCLRERRSPRGPFSGCTKGEHQIATACLVSCPAHGAGSDRPSAAWGSPGFGRGGWSDAAGSDGHLR